MTTSSNFDEISMNIVGVVRNGGLALAETLVKVEQLITQVERHLVVIATNDNTDQTDQVLSDFAGRNSDVQIVRLDGLVTQFPERFDRITAARNAVLEVTEDSGVENTLTLMLDLDGPSAHLNLDAILNAAQRQSPEWDAVFANSKPAYYDLYALRCQGWCEEDVWQHVNRAKEPMFKKRRWWRALLSKTVYSKQYNIPSNGMLIPVESAFAGAGLYKTDALKGLRYACRDENGGYICEHVLFHKEMRARGARLYIDTAILTIAPIEHLGEGSGAPFPDDLTIKAALKN